MKDYSAKIYALGILFVCGSAIYNIFELEECKRKIAKQKSTIDSLSLLVNCAGQQEIMSFPARGDTITCDSVAIEL